MPLLRELIGKRKHRLDDLSLDEVRLAKVKLEQEQVRLMRRISDLEKEKARLFRQGVNEPSKRRQLLIAQRIQELESQASNYDKNVAICQKQMRVLHGIIFLKESRKSWEDTAVGQVLASMDLTELEGFIDQATANNVFQMDKFSRLLGSLEEADDFSAREELDEGVAQILAEMQAAREAAGVRVSGEHSVAAKGIQDSTIITGDRSTAQQRRYNIQMESARGLAIGDGAQVLVHEGKEAESTTEGYAVARLQSTLDNQRALLNRSFQLLAGVTSELTAGLSGTRFALLSQQETAVINVTVRAEDMDIKPGWVQQVVFRRTGEPSLTEFELTPRATGLKIIGIEYYYEQHWLASLELPVEVVDKAEMEPVPQISE